MRFRSSAHALPLGVDLAQRSFSVVAARATSDGCAVRAAHTEDLPESTVDRRERRTAELSRDIVARVAGNERRCILSAPPSETVVRTFRLPPGMSRREAERAAWLEADTLVEWPGDDRLVALDAITGLRRPDATEHRAFQFDPAIDGDRACRRGFVRLRWTRRCAPGDAPSATRTRCSTVRAIAPNSSFSATPVGVSHVFAPRLIDERLAAQTRSAFVDARRDGLADVRRLAILASPLRYEILEEHVRDDGYRVAPVRVGDVSAPSWALAYGLASWSFARQYAVTA